VATHTLNGVSAAMSTILTRLALMILCVFVMTRRSVCEEVSARTVLEELVAVRAANFGKIISWRGSAELRSDQSRRNVHTTLARRVHFVRDVGRACCRCTTAPIVQTQTSGTHGSLNLVAMMKKDSEYFTLVSYSIPSQKGLLLEYRPLEVFATLGEIPGSGDYFDPIERWDYYRAENSMPSRALAALGARESAVGVSVQLEGSTVNLEWGAFRSSFDLDKGGLTTSVKLQVAGQTWTASHVNVGGIWLPSVVRSEIDTSGVSQVTETVWKDHEVNVPTEGEFTLAAMGAYNGLRLLDHVRNSQRTLVGPDYLPQPSNLAGEVNRPEEGGHWRRWTLWINAAVVVVAAVAILLRLAMRSRFAH
jgi:hypothetical protein